MTLTEQLATPAGHLSALQACFETAREKVVAEEGTVEERSYRIAGLGVRVRFAGPALVDRVVPAFEHLEVPGAWVPDLDVCFWDSASTGIAPPPSPFALDRWGPLGELEGFCDDTTWTVFDQHTGSLNVLDRHSGRSIFWVRDAARVEPWQTGFPLRVILGRWGADHGLRMAHTAAVGTDAGFVLLTGKGGSGKTTTALACLEAGLGYAGDDFCLVRAEPTPVVHSIYSTAKVAPDAMARFPSLTDLVLNPGRAPEEKAVVRLTPRFAPALTATAPLEAVVMPVVVGGRRSRLVPASHAEALLALAPSSIFAVSGTRSDALADLAAVVRALPTYRLELGTDLDGIVDIVRSLAVA